MTLTAIWAFGAIWSVKILFAYWICSTIIIILEAIISWTNDTFEADEFFAKSKTIKLLVPQIDMMELRDDNEGVFALMSVGWIAGNIIFMIFWPIVIIGSIIALIAYKARKYKRNKND